MNNLSDFKIRLKEPYLLRDTDPPEDPLGELTHFELGIRRFCFECNHVVSLEMGTENIEVFLDPDICLILEDEISEKISKIYQGNLSQIDFLESVCLSLVFEPLNRDCLRCTWKKFGYVSAEHFTLKTSDIRFELNKFQVLSELSQFVDILMQMALDGGYITAEEKQEFLMPLREMVPNTAIL